MLVSAVGWKIPEPGRRVEPPGGVRGGVAGRGWEPFRYAPVDGAVPRVGRGPLATWPFGAAGVEALLVPSVAIFGVVGMVWRSVEGSRATKMGRSIRP